MSYKNNVEDIVSWIKEFLETEFSNEERHIRRVDKINKYEEDNN
jgi:ribose 5-phosphate isomerase RpiB